MSVKILDPGMPQNEDTDDGREMLLRDFRVEINGEVFLAAAGRTHDGSSWPRCTPGPRQARIKRAGIVHDLACQDGRFGCEPDAREISYAEANELWYLVARAGSCKKVRAGWFWSRVGRIGLAVGCYPTWRRYRRGGG